MLKKEEKFILVGPMVRRCCYCTFCMVIVRMSVANARRDFIPVALYLLKIPVKCSTCHRSKNLDKVPLPG